MCHFLYVIKLNSCVHSLGTELLAILSALWLTFLLISRLIFFEAINILLLKAELIEQLLYAKHCSKHFTQQSHLAYKEIGVQRD